MGEGGVPSVARECARGNSDSKEGKSGMYYVSLLWKGIIFFIP